VAEHWIEARDAGRLVRSTEALCERVAAGIVRCRAKRLTINGDVAEDTSLPDWFWLDDGRERLQQDWESGDFVACYDGLTSYRAFGVQFQASDILDFLPFEERAAAARSLSVTGNIAWVSAREARRFAYEKAGLNPMIASDALVEQCRLGFVVARAVGMRWARESNPNDWSDEAREWDIPIWFWEHFISEVGSSQNWEQGLSAGRGLSPRGYGSMTLNGVHFLRSSLDVLLPTDGHELTDSKKPALPEAELRRWWEKLAGVRDGLSQEQLRALATCDHPQHTVARDRIRALAEGRKPGPRSS
jgi:hypothetical protein